MAVFKNVEPRKRMLALLMLGTAGVILLGLLLALILSPASPAPPASSPLESVADVALTGGLPSFDQQALDPTTKKLFVAHPGNNDVIVFDTQSNTVTGHITGIKKNHGLVVIPEINRLYVSETFDNQVYAVDEKTFHILAKISVGQKPDTIAYDPNDHELFVSNELGKSDTVIDVRTNRVVATIPLNGEVGNTRFDAGLHRIFATIQTTNQVVAIDPVSRRVTARVNLPASCNHNHGLVLDTTQQLGIAECDLSANIFLFDLQSLHVITNQGVAQSPDIMTFDDGRHLLYVSSRTGTLSIFDDSNKTLQKVHEQCLASGAHSIAVDPVTHRIYLPLLRTSSTACVAPTSAPSPVASSTAKAASTVVVNGNPVLRVMLFHYKGV